MLVPAVLALAAVAPPSRLIEAASTLPPAASQMRLRIPFSLTREDPQYSADPLISAAAAGRVLTPGLRRVTDP